MRNIKILLCSSEIGAGTRGSGLGPDAVKASCINKEFSLFKNYPYESCKVNNDVLFHETNNFAKHIGHLFPVLESNASTMKEAILSGHSTLIFSGDHSNAIGFASGLKDAYPDQRIGLVWIDAHGDIHSPYTSPSGNIHGMPIAALLGLENKKLKIKNPPSEVIDKWKEILQLGYFRIQPKFKPQDIVFIDIRDLEKEEWDIIHELNIKYFSPEERNSIGIGKILEKADMHLAGHDMIYVSFDVDSMDPGISRGTGTPVHGGLSLDDAKKVLNHYFLHPKTKALEITEINPLLDNKNAMADVVVDMLKEFIPVHHPLVND